MARSIKLAALIVVLAISAADQSHAQMSGADGKRVALVVGNSRYDHIPRLDNPANDARLVGQTLKGLGFAMVGDGPRLDLDKPSFDRAVQEFGRTATGASVALFYYAGHALQVRGTNWLMPTTANPEREADLDFQMVDANLVLRQMEAAGTKLNLMILDACRNNPFGGRGLRAAAGGLAQMQAPEGTLIVYATQPGNVAMDGMDGNSPFTKALAQTIRRPGLDVFRLFNEVGLNVKRTTAGAQQPWVSSSPIDGEFYFAGPAAVEASAAPAQLAGLIGPALNFDEAKLRSLAAQRQVPLPDRIAFESPGPAVPPAHAAYLGAWYTPNVGRGRETILIVTSVGASGNAIGFHAIGPVTTAGQIPPGYIEFNAPITEDGIKYATPNGLKFSFLLRSNGTMMGTLILASGHPVYFTLARVE